MTFGVVASSHVPFVGTFFSDDFNRADSTNLGSDWTEVTGDWAIASNKLANTSASGARLVVTNGAGVPAPSSGLYTWAQVTVSSASTATQTGLVMCYEDSSNFDHIRYNSTSGVTRWEVYKWVGGTPSLLRTYVSFPSPPYTLTVYKDSSGAFYVYVDGSGVFNTVGFETTDNTGTEVGIRLNSSLSTSATYDNLSAGTSTTRP